MKYVNISDQELIINGLGVVKPGDEIEAPKGFNNANFKPVTKEAKETSEPENKKNNINNNEQSISR